MSYRPNIWLNFNRGLSSMLGNYSGPCVVWDEDGPTN